MITGEDGSAGLLPAVARQLRGVFEVLALPAETVAQPLDRDADLFEHAVLAETRRGHLHELVDLHRLATTVRAQRQPESGRALAFTVAGVDDHEATALALGFVIGLLARRGFNLHGVSSVKR
ncbi:hypothetical protein FQZ97_1114750 [compost metagenome]